MISADYFLPRMHPVHKRRIARYIRLWYFDLGKTFSLCSRIFFVVVAGNDRLTGSAASRIIGFCHRGDVTGVRRCCSMLHSALNPRRRSRLVDELWDRLLAAALKRTPSTSIRCIVEFVPRGFRAAPTGYNVLATLSRITHPHAVRETQRLSDRFTTQIDEDLKSQLFWSQKIISANLKQSHKQMC